MMCASSDLTLTGVVNLTSVVTLATVVIVMSVETEMGDVTLISAVIDECML